MPLRSYSSAEKRANWRKTLVFFSIGLIVFAPLFLIGFPHGLISPAGTSELLRAFLMIASIACVVIGLAYGPATSLEDREVRRHSGSGPIVNPATIALQKIAGGILIFCVILLARYIYLFFTNS